MANAAVMSGINVDAPRITGFFDAPKIPCKKPNRRQVIRVNTVKGSK